MNGWIIAGIIVVALVILIFNSFISLRNAVRKSWAGIDVQLKRRSDLIPNLVSTVKGYVKHEKTLLENITKARTAIMDAQKKGDVAKAAKADDQISGALKSLFAVSENYPKLRANENFLELQGELSRTEDQVAAARRIYNENVTYYNTKIQTFPNSLIANIFNFDEEKLFEANATEKKNVKVEI